jgi:hypothetical protein
MSLFRIGLILLAVFALTGVSRSIEAWAPAIVVKMDATWQKVCDRTFIRQRAVVTNYTVKELCFTKSVCGSDKLLAVEDDKGSGVAFGLSCGRSASDVGDRIEDPWSEFVVVRSHHDKSFDYAGDATIVQDLDGPEQNLTKERQYRGRAQFGYVRCEDLRALCPGEKCRWSELEKRMEREVLPRVVVRHVADTCPKVK